MLATACQSGGEPAQGEPVQRTAQASSLEPVGASPMPPADPRWTQADEQILAPVWAGNDDQGSVYLPLWRGAAAAIEDYVFAPPDGDCRPLKGTVRVDWDSTANTVHFLVKLRGVPVHPAVHRTSGVDFFPNAFFRPPIDIDNGQYRFWTILSSVANFALFYYRLSDFQLVGSQYDFPGGQPAGTLAVASPVFAIAPSHLMQPDEDGFVVHEWTVAYDHFTVEGGLFSFSYFTFVPQDLCQGSQYQLAISQLRPYATPWLPPSQAFSWRAMLHLGLTFDTTVDDASQTYPQTDGFPPYVESGVAFLGNAAAVQGGIPRGWRISIPSLITQVAPPIRQVPNGDGLGCQAYIVDPHLTGPNFCAGH
jgi:hypothetical protein